MRISDYEIMMSGMKALPDCERSRGEIVLDVLAAALSGGLVAWVLYKLIF